VARGSGTSSAPDADAAGDRFGDGLDVAAPSADRRPAETPARPRRRIALGPGTWLFVVVVLALGVLTPAYVARLYQVPTGSMETTLHGCAGCENDRVLVDRAVYRFRPPRVGEIVVFAAPSGWQNTVALAARPDGPLRWLISRVADVVGIQRPDEVDFIKRVIAVGGQTVFCCDASNRLVRDGKPVDEPYIYFGPTFGPPRQRPFGPAKVPPGMIWVMGDSRNNSDDSRINGPVPISNVVGEARLIVAPRNRFGVIGDN
jgi:signal peptidase I